MAETLHKILTKYVSSRLLQETSQEEKDETVQALELKIEKEIIEEKSNELTLQQTEMMQREGKSSMNNDCRIRLTVQKMCFMVLE